jgi:hypothetical protein
MQKKRISPVCLCSRLQLWHLSVSVPVRVTYHSQYTCGVEHHRLVGLKPVVEFIETTLEVAR